MCRRALRPPGTKGVLVPSGLRAFTFSHDQSLTNTNLVRLGAPRSSNGVQGGFFSCACV